MCRCRGLRGRKYVTEYELLIETVLVVFKVIQVFYSDVVKYKGVFFWQENGGDSIVPLFSSTASRKLHTR